MSKAPLRFPRVTRFVCVVCGARVTHREKGGGRRKYCRACARTKRDRDLGAYYAFLTSREAG